MPAEEEIDELIEHITVDAYADEGYWAFLQEFVGEWSFPLPGILAGMPVVVTGVDFDGNERRGLVAVIVRDDHRTTVALVDLELPPADQAGRNLLCAYRRWLGTATADE